MTTPKYHNIRRVDVLNDYKCMSAAGVAAKYDISEYSVRQNARELGFSKKDYLVAERQRYAPELQKRRQDIVDYFRTHSTKDTAAAFSISQGAVRYAAKKIGYKKEVYDNALRFSSKRKIENAPGFFNRFAPYIATAAAGLTLVGGYIGVTGCAKDNPGKTAKPIAGKPINLVAKVSAAVPVPVKGSDDYDAVKVKQGIEKIADEPSMPGVILPSNPAPVTIGAPLVAKPAASAKPIIQKSQPKPAEPKYSGLTPEQKALDEKADKAEKATMVRLADEDSKPAAPSKPSVPNTHKHSARDIDASVTGGYDALGAGSAGVLLSGKRYFTEGSALFGDESGFGIDAGRIGERFDGHLAFQSVGDLSQVVAGARAKFDSRLSALGANGYFGDDFSGADIQADINLWKSQDRKSKLDAIVKGYAFDMNGDSVSGVYGALRASRKWKWGALFAETGIHSNDELTGEQWGARAGFMFGGNPDFADRQSFFGLNELNNGVLGHPITQSGSGSSTGTGTTSGGSSGTSDGNGNNNGNNGHTNPGDTAPSVPGVVTPGNPNTPSNGGVPGVVEPTNPNNNGNTVPPAVNPTNPNSGTDVPPVVPPVSMIRMNKVFDDELNRAFGPKGYAWDKRYA